MLFLLWGCWPQLASTGWNDLPRRNLRNLPQRLHGDWDDKLGFSLLDVDYGVDALTLFRAKQSSGPVFFSNA